MQKNLGLVIVTMYDLGLLKFGTSCLAKTVTRDLWISSQAHYFSAPMNPTV